MRSRQTDRHAHTVCTSVNRQPKCCFFVRTCNALRTASLTQTDLSLDLEGYHHTAPSPPFPPVYMLFISPMKIKFSSCTGRGGWGLRQWWVVGYLFLTPVKSRHVVGGMGRGGGEQHAEMIFITDRGEEVPPSLFAAMFTQPFHLAAAGSDFIRGETQYGNHGYTCGGTHWKWKR